ncbi:MAG: complement resistance protein TraT [Coxiellaceae bacterium]|nr:complement resistance protein TraT [Coxiellaceae bacterium]
MINRWVRTTVILFTALSVMVLSGCAATQLAITKRNLSVSTKTSASIFLDPVPDSQKVVYVQLRNTSGVSSFSIRNALISQLHQKGYKTTRHLSRAHYMIQANTLRVKAVSQTAARAVMGSGFGSALVGGGLGAATGAIAGASSSGIWGMGLVGAAAGTLVDNMVKDVNYVAVVDVQISVRSQQAIRQHKRSRLSQGTSSVTTQRSNDKTHWKRYRTRVVGRAEKVNLHYSQARGPLERSIGSAIAGYF